MSLPLGPCTSTCPPCKAIFTPAGTGIGFRPIRDICSSLAPETQKNPRSEKPGTVCRAPTKSNQLPNLAKNFAADLGFAGGTAAHQAFRRGQNVDAETANDRANLGCAKIAARAGTDGRA